jgi:hypothetical protein
MLAENQHFALAGTQVRLVLGERGLRRAVSKGQLIKLWQGAYALETRSATAGPADPALIVGAAHGVPVVTRLAAAELTIGRQVTACLHTAAELYGFATDSDSKTHVIGVAHSQRTGLAVHRTPPLEPTHRAYGFDVVGAAETAVRLVLQGVIFNQSLVSAGQGPSCDRVAFGADVTSVAVIGSVLAGTRKQARLPDE